MAGKKIFGGKEENIIVENFVKELNEKTNKKITSTNKKINKFIKETEKKEKTNSKQIKDLNNLLIDLINILKDKGIVELSEFNKENKEKI